jgi:hypothetical protein
VELGSKNRKQTIAAIVLGVVLLLIIGYEVLPIFSTNASTMVPAAASNTEDPPARNGRPLRRNSAGPGKKSRATQDLDPTLHLQQLAAIEQIKYQGSGKNIFVAEADTTIPMPVKNGTTDQTKTAADSVYQAPPVAASPPIPLKFFGFASHPGEPKKIFLSKGDDVFIAGEGEIVDRRYKVLHISATSVEIQDVVASGPPQTIPLTQG